MAGILLGVESGIPQAVQEAFRLTGTSHIIVIFGFDITIITALFTLLFSRLLGRLNDAITAFIGIIIYSIVKNESPTLEREILSHRPERDDVLANDGT
ncbi:MAG: ComEC/Rec2 family competence protein [Anaerolineales bacterium]